MRVLGIVLAQGIRCRETRLEKLLAERARVEAAITWVENTYYGGRVSVAHEYHSDGDDEESEEEVDVDEESEEDGEESEGEGEESE